MLLMGGMVGAILNDSGDDGHAETDSEKVPVFNEPERKKKRGRRAGGGDNNAIQHEPAPISSASTYGT